MKNKRLTNCVRRNIVTNATKSLKPDENELFVGLTATFERNARKLFDAQEKLCKTLHGYVDRWDNWNAAKIRIQIGGSEIERTIPIPEFNDRPFIYANAHKFSRHVMEACYENKHFKNRIDKYRDQYKNWKEAVEGARRIVNACTNTKQLNDTWPKGMQYVPKWFLEETKQELVDLKTVQKVDLLLGKQYN